MITINNLSKSYGTRVLFDNLSFSVGKGEKIGLVGRNGYGKTTLIRTILGEIRPIAGRVVIGGGVRIGVQKQDLFHVENESPLMYIWDRYPQMDHPGFS